MNIVLYDKNPNGQHFSEKEIFHSIAHEIGHALGIMGHSYNPDDLMYSTQNNLPSVFDKFKTDIHTLSSRDVSTIELLYRLEPTVTDKISSGSTLLYAPIILGSKEDILDRKIEEAKDYIKASPAIATGYIDLANAYTQKGNYKDAEQTLLNALKYAKANDEAYIIYYNLAIISCSVKQFNKAQDYVNQAKQIKNSPDLAEIEYFINNKIVPAL